LFSDNPEVNDAARNAAISGGLTGGLVGAMAPMLSSSPKNWRKMLIESLGSAAVGGGASGIAAGGGTLLGSSILGPPDPSDASAFTRRATLGSVLGGGVGGALLGATAAKFGKMPSFSPALLRKAIRRLSQSKRPASYGAAAGGTMGALGSGFIGSDEGMQVDFINNELRRQKMRDMLTNSGY
jgi:hypothetical protein